MLPILKNKNLTSVDHNYEEGEGEEGERRGGMGMGGGGEGGGGPSVTRIHITLIFEDAASTINRLANRKVSHASLQESSAHILQGRVRSCSLPCLSSGAFSCLSDTAEVLQYPLPLFSSFPCCSRERSILECLLW